MVPDTLANLHENLVSNYCEVPLYLVFYDQNDHLQLIGFDSIFAEPGETRKIPLGNQAAAYVRCFRPGISDSFMHGFVVRQVGHYAIRRSGIRVEENTMALERPRDPTVSNYCYTRMHIMPFNSSGAVGHIVFESRSVEPGETRKLPLGSRTAAYAKCIHPGISNSLISGCFVSKGGHSRIDSSGVRARTEVVMEEARGDLEERAKGRHRSRSRSRGHSFGRPDFLEEAQLQAAVAASVAEAAMPTPQATATGL